MRTLVAILALLATIKVAAHAYVVATAKSEIIVSAYRERAAGACDKASRIKRLKLAATWEKPSSVRLVIGKGSLDVPFWQVDHALWRARYKNPYLFLTLDGEPHKIYCEFDIVQGAAAVFTM